MRTYKKFCTNALVILFISPAYGDCGDDSRRLIYGEEPLSANLYDAAKAIKRGAWKNGEFFEEEFHYLGVLLVGGEELYVTYLNTVWGASCRSTSRIIFFDKSLNEVGQYYGLTKPVMRGRYLAFISPENEVLIKNFWDGFPTALSDGESNTSFFESPP